MLDVEKSICTFDTKEAVHISLDLFVVPWQQLSYFVHQAVQIRDVPDPTGEQHGTSWKELTAHQPRDEDCSGDSCVWVQRLVSPAELPVKLVVAVQHPAALLRVGQEVVHDGLLLKTQKTWKTISLFRNNQSIFKK